MCVLGGGAGISQSLLTSALVWDSSPGQQALLSVANISVSDCQGNRGYPLARRARIPS